MKITKCLSIFVLALTIINAQAQSGEELFGLYTTSGEALTLTSANTDVAIEGPNARIVHTQVYQNTFAEDTDLVYFYSKSENVILDSFEATWEQGGVVVKVMNKDEAKAIFDQVAVLDVAPEAIIDDGNVGDYPNGGDFGEDDQDLDGYPEDGEEGGEEENGEEGEVIPDPFSLYDTSSKAFVLGKIPAGKNVTIKYSMIQKLEVVANKFLGFSLYSTLVKDYDMYTKPLTSTVDYNKSALKNSSIDWKFKVSINADAKLENVVNPTQNLSPKYTTIGKVYNAVWESNISLANSSADFVILYTHANMNQPDFTFTKHPTIESDWTLSVNFIPQFNNLTAAEIVSAISNNSTLAEINDKAWKNSTARGEYIFIIDTTAGVSAAKLAEVKKDLISYFYQIPDYSFFNIIVFGDQISYFNGKSLQLYTYTYTNALKWINDNIKPSNGSLDLLDALKATNILMPKSYYPRNLIVFTNSNSTNETEVLNFVSEKKDKQRVCVAGFDDVSESFIAQIGELGNCVGMKLNISDPLDPVLHSAVAPVIQDLNVTATCNNTKGETIFSYQASQGFFMKDKSYAHIIHITGLVSPSGCSINFGYYNSYSSTINSRKFNFKGFSLAKDTDVLHKLYVADESDASANATEVTELSVKYQVESDNTAWVSFSKSANNGLIYESLAYLFGNNETGNGVTEGDDSNPAETETPTTGNATNSTGSSNNQTNTTAPANNSTNNSTGNGTTPAQNTTNTNTTTNSTTNSTSNGGKWNVSIIINGKEYNALQAAGEEPEFLDSDNAEEVGEYGEYEGEEDFGEEVGEYGEETGEYGEYNGEEDFGEEVGEYGEEWLAYGEEDFGEEVGEYGEEVGEYGEYEGEESWGEESWGEESYGEESWGEESYGEESNGEEAGEYSGEDSDLGEDGWNHQKPRHHPKKQHDNKPKKHHDDDSNALYFIAKKHKNGRNAQ